MWRRNERTNRSRLDSLRPGRRWFRSTISLTIRRRSAAMSSRACSTGASVTAIVEECQSTRPDARKTGSSNKSSNVSNRDQISTRHTRSVVSTKHKKRRAPGPRQDPSPGARPDAIAVDDHRRRVPRARRRRLRAGDDAPHRPGPAAGQDRRPGRCLRIPGAGQGGRPDRLPHGDRARCRGARGRRRRAPPAARPTPTC